MSRMIVYPLGNADCTLIELDNGQHLIFDYADSRDATDLTDRRIDLATAVRADLDGRDTCDVVAFTHADADHIRRASEFFHLLHHRAYQGNGRIKIKELWVPSALITEPNLKDDARLLQAEARYRLREGSGIRVFSSPNHLSDWFKREGISPASRAHLISNAGTVVPSFTKALNGVEFFVHSPFAVRQDKNTVVDRNNSSLVLQVTFVSGGKETRVILAGDVTHEVLDDIVTVTRMHKRDERLEWDIIKVPHHCSYLSLSAEKGSTITAPDANIAWLYDTQAHTGAHLISSSNPIPTNDDDVQPPHPQAAAYYRACVTPKNGQFLVTMENPTESHPERLIITMDRFGATLKKVLAAGSSFITSRSAPRAG